MIDPSFLTNFWRFPWPIMDVLIAGKSSIDLPELQCMNWEQATDFVRGYGYDPDDAQDLLKSQAVMIEAIAFIESKLVTPQEWSTTLRPPDDILMAEDPRQLIIWASHPSPNHGLRKAWACAILRVMHTIAHIEGVTLTASHAQAVKQITERFNRFVERDASNNFWLGSQELRVAIERIEWKHNKSRHSIILKLLHKRDNVAETIYDYLGVRIVTHRLCDVMLVVKILHELNIISYPNCYPSRARNSLIDYPRFRSQTETLLDLLTSGSISPAEFETMITRLTAAEDGSSPNPHSASSYRSIQITGRQLVRTRDERLEWLDKLAAEIHSKKISKEVERSLRELHTLVKDWHSTQTQPITSAHFFPFEVQILDHDSYKHATSGEANHDRYKSSQLAAARERVLGQVLKIARPS